MQLPKEISAGNERNSAHFISLITSFLYRLDRFENLVLTSIVLCIWYGVLHTTEIENTAIWNLTNKQPNDLFTINVAVVWLSIYIVSPPGAWNLNLIQKFYDWLDVANLKRSTRQRFCSFAGFWLFCHLICNGGSGEVFVCNCRGVFLEIGIGRFTDDWIHTLTKYNTMIVWYLCSKRNILCMICRQ